MNPKILCIGSIGAIAETSELQRRAYNQALKENGVDWEWSEDTYRELLKSNGGKKRLQTLSEATNSSLSTDTIDRIHKRKTELAGQLIQENETSPRKGLKEIIESAKDDGMRIVWVTTTSKDNTDAILSAFGDELDPNTFEHIFHRDDVVVGKPSPDIYRYMLEYLGVDASECIAIEDCLNSACSSKGAGIYTVVCSGAYHDDELKHIVDKEIDDFSNTSWEEIKNDYTKTVKQEAIASH